MQSADAAGRAGVTKFAELTGEFGRRRRARLLPRPQPAGRRAARRRRHRHRGQRRALGAAARSRSAPTSPRTAARSRCPAPWRSRSCAAAADRALTPAAPGGPADPVGDPAGPARLLPHFRLLAPCRRASRSRVRPSPRPAPRPAMKPRTALLLAFALHAIHPAAAQDVAAPSPRYCACGVPACGSPRGVLASGALDPCRRPATRRPRLLRPRLLRRRLRRRGRSRPRHSPEGAHPEGARNAARRGGHRRLPLAGGRAIAAVAGLLPRAGRGRAPGPGSAARPRGARATPPRAFAVAGHGARPRARRRQGVLPEARSRADPPRCCACATDSRARSACSSTRRPVHARARGAPR